MDLYVTILANYERPSIHTTDNLVPAHYPRYGTVPIYLLCTIFKFRVNYVLVPGTHSRCYPISKFKNCERCVLPSTHLSVQWLSRENLMLARSSMAMSMLQATSAVRQPTPNITTHRRQSCREVPVHRSQM
jgi:hypothetical protein